MGFLVRRSFRRAGSVMAGKVLNPVFRLAVLLIVLRLCSGSYAQSVEAPAARTQLSSSTPQAAKTAEALGRDGASSTRTVAFSEEVERLRHEVEQLRSELAQLRSIVGDAVNSREAVASESSLARSNVPTQESKQQQPKPSATQDEKNKPEASQKLAPTEPALTSKAKGGDLSGAGNLLRTDRITIGGYGDFQFRQSSINERADGGGTPTFQNTRLVLGIAAVLAEKQNIVFNSEIEYEFGSREIDVEQAYVEWRVRPEFAFRGGIFVPAIGRFNTFHDSYLNLTTVRPLINQFIVPTAYRDAGIGVRGRFKLPYKMKLTYEADVVNGMRSTNADGEPTPFSRLLGQSSASEPGLFAFQAHRSSKAVVGRIGLSINGLEVGASIYNGKFTDLGEPSQSATILFLDGSYHRGALTINGEYGRSNIVGGIPRRSPAPPLFDANDPASIAALAEFVAQRTPGQDGFYLEGAYKFSPPRGLAAKFDEGSYISPVVRYEVVRLDRTLANFYLNRSRTTLGLNIAPSSTVIFKLNYLFNHAFGPIPNAAAAVGGALFGASPLPYRGYGKNGFTGSIAYVF